jgi:hypothetical protein
MNSKRFVIYFIFCNLMIKKITLDEKTIAEKTTFDVYFLRKVFFCLGNTLRFGRVLKIYFWNLKFSKNHQMLLRVSHLKKQKIPYILGISPWAYLANEIFSSEISLRAYA